MRRAIESMYKDKCTIIEKRKVRNEITKKTSLEDVEVIINQPCRLSFKSISSTKSDSSTATISQIVKLLISPDIIIKPGSKLIVTHKGRISKYKSSGMPAVYTNHQEVVLELDEGRA